MSDYFKYLLRSNEFKYYRWTNKKQELLIFMVVISGSYFVIKGGIPFVIFKGIPFIFFKSRQLLIRVLYGTKTKVFSWFFLTKSGCLAALSYIKLPITLGPYNLIVVNPIKVGKGSFLVTKYLLWDHRILKGLIVYLTGMPFTIGFRPVHVLAYMTMFVYLNWYWNAFGEIERGFARGNMPDHVYYARFRKKRIRQPGQKKDRILDKWVPGSLGTPFKWEYLKDIRLFIWFIGTWW